MLMTVFLATSEKPTIEYSFDPVLLAQTISPTVASLNPDTEHPTSKFEKSDNITYISPPTGTNWGLETEILKAASPFKIDMELVAAAFSTKVPAESVGAFAV